MSTLIKAPAAKSDLKEIWQYIAQDSVKNADAFLAQIENKCQTLAENPFLGRSRDELTDNLRSHSIKAYTIFYCPIPNGVEIIRILHGARDIISLF